MKNVTLTVFVMSPLLLWTSQPQARECTPGKVTFALVSTQSGFSWQGVTLAIGTLGANRGTAKAQAARHRPLTNISFGAPKGMGMAQDMPSLLWEGTMRFSSNVWGFSRKLEIRQGALEAADLSFCDRHQLTLRCAGITGYPSEGAISMRCTLEVMSPEAVVAP